MDSDRSKWTAFYASKWETMYSDDDFLISLLDVAIAKARLTLAQEQVDEDKQQIDEEDKEILQLMADLDNGSTSDDAYTPVEHHEDWNSVVKQFKKIYKISSADWQILLQEIKLRKSTKKITCWYLIKIAEEIKKQRHNDKQETE